MGQAAQDVRSAQIGPRPPVGGAVAIFFLMMHVMCSSAMLNSGGAQPTLTSTCVPSTLAS